LAGGVAGGAARPVLAALAASWLFFAGLAAGSVALAAAVRLASGGWARPILPLAEAGTAFFVPAAVWLVAVVAGLPFLLPSGLPSAFAALRLLASAAAVFWSGRRFVELARSERADPSRVRAAALGYVLVYVIGLSLWAFDLVLRLSSGPMFTVVPAFYFMGAFVSGLAWVSLVAAWRDISGPDLRHDLGKLLFAFIVLWTYLLWALFLPTWYGDVPEEVAVLLRRWRGGYQPVAAAMLVAVFAWPFWLLFSERFKRRRGTLAAGAAAVLLGLWGEGFLLVLPSLSLRPDAAAVLVGVGVALGVAATFLLALAGRLPPAPDRALRT
ncbi:MAG TPA: hypothetical protein VF805_07775, partial [Anaeromyxobacteraceae bacterium]